MKVFSTVSSHHRLGGAKIRKPHEVIVFVGDTVIEFKFSAKEYDLMWEINKVVEKEMRLNLKYQVYAFQRQEVTK